MARCVAAKAAGFVDKYNDDFGVLAQAVDEIGRNSHIVTGSLHNALCKLARKCRDVRLSDTLEETLVPLEQGMKDAEVAKIRCLSTKTIEDINARFWPHSGMTWRHGLRASPISRANWGSRRATL